VPSVPLVVVPDPDDPECADVLVDVSVDGRAYRMVLGSGAAHTHLVDAGDPDGRDRRLSDDRPLPAAALGVHARP